MGRGVQDVAGGGLLLGDDVVPLQQMLAGDQDFTAAVHRGIPDLYAGLGFHLENSAGQGLAVNVHLGDGQLRLLVVFEMDGGRAVGDQRDHLMFRVDDVAVRDGVLPHLDHAGVQVLDEDFAVCVCGLGGDGAAVRLLDSKRHALHRLPGHSVHLHNFQIRLGLVVHHQLGQLAGEELHMELTLHLHIAGRRVHLLDGVHARLQIVDADFAVHIGDPVQIVAAILNFGNAEGCAGEVFTRIGVILYQLKVGLGRVGKDKLRVFVGVELDDADSIIYEIAVRGLQLPHLIGAGVQLAEVNFPVDIRGELLPEAAAHLLELKADIGQGGHGHAVHLDKMDAGLAAIEEDHLFDAVPRVELHLLGRGVQHMAVI